MVVLWRLRLTGAPQLQGGDDPLRVLPLSRKDAGWLAYVALNPGAASLQVATLVWPGTDARGALNSLRQRVHRLRKASGARLVETAEQIRLADDLALDEPDIDALLAQDPETAPGLLLAGHEYDAETEFAAWLAAARRGRAAALQETLARLASEAEAQASLAQALRYARRLLAEDHLSEHAHRRLMRLHYLRGDTAAAVAAFEACEATLKDELGLKPSAETLRLLQTVEKAHAVAPRAQGPVPASLVRPPRLVGRDALLAELSLAQQQAQVAVLVGEAGIGKTRLLQELLAGRADALHVQARPGDQAVPYGTLGRLLRALATRDAPRLPDELDLGLVLGPAAEAGGAPTTPQRLQAALEARLAQASHAGLQLLAADDLHFADRASVEMLLALTQSEALPRLRWVLAQRPPGAGDPTDVAGALAAPLLRALSESPQARWLVLQPLTEAQLHELLDSLDLPDFEARDWAPALTRHTGGNPLFVIETLRAMLGARPAGAALPRPQSIGQLIDRRLEQLSRPALTLARVAAIAAPDFSIQLAEQVLATPALALADAWRELEQAGVLRGEAFAHDLVHDAMLRATPAPIARHVRRSVAEFLEQCGVEPARLALHWQAAGDPEREAQAWMAAAQRAHLAMCLPEELDLLQRALVPLQALDARARLRSVLVQLSALRSAAGELAGAQQAAEQCLGLATSDAERLPGLVALMDVHSAALRDAESLACAQDVVACARRCNDEAAELKGWRGIAGAHAKDGRYEQAARIHADCGDRLRALPPSEESLEWAIDHAFTLDRLGRQSEAVQLLAQTVQTAQRAGFGRIAVEAQGNQVMSTYRMGATAQALSLAEQIHADAVRDDASIPVNPIDEALLGALLRDVGRFDEALRVLGAALAAARAKGAHGWVAAMNDALALAYARLGQHHRAAPLLADPTATDDVLAMTLRTIHRVQVARLDPARVGLGADMLEPLLRLDLPPRWHLGILLELALESRDPQGLHHAERGLVLATQHGGPAFELRARLVLTEVLMAMRDDAAAARQAMTAAAALASMDAFYVYRPESLWTCCRALAASQPGLAATLHEQALRWIDQAAAVAVPAEFRDSFRFRNAVNAQIVRHRKPPAG